MKRVKSNKNFLHSYLDSNTKTRKDLIRKAKSEQIRCLCELILNVLNANVPTDTSTLEKLKKHKSSIKKVVFAKGPLKTRQKILVQRGGSFLPLIISTVLGALSLLKK